MLPGLNPGDQLLRRELHAKFGGIRQGGIALSQQAAAVLFFTDPKKGHQHGYYDGWGSDGLFHYVGAGQRGDRQRLHEEGHKVGRMQVVPAGESRPLYGDIWDQTEDTLIEAKALLHATRYEWP